MYCESVSFTEFYFFFFLEIVRRLFWANVKRIYEHYTQHPYDTQPTESDALFIIQKQQTEIITKYVRGACKCSNFHYLRPKSFAVFSRGNMFLPLVMLWCIAYLEFKKKVLRFGRSMIPWGWFTLCKQRVNEKILPSLLFGCCYTMWCFF